MTDVQKSAIELYASLVIDSVFDTLIVVDADLKVQDINRSIEEFGYTKEQMIGRPLTDIVVDDMAFRAAIVEMAAAAREGRRDLRRFQIVCGGGVTCFAEVTAREITLTDAEDYLIAFSDSTERVAAENAVAEQKALIEKALAETEQLRRDAENSRLQLQVANEQLAKRQAATEKALEEEQEYRLQSAKQNFQKTFAMYLVALVAFSLLLPYIGSVIGAGEKLLDNSGQLSLLLLQTLGAVAAFLFARSENEKQQP